MPDGQERLAMLKRALGAELASRRKAARVTQQHLAHQSGWSRSSVTHVEAGRQLLDPEFWQTADRLVAADGRLLARFHEVMAAIAEHDQAQIAALRAGAAAPAAEVLTHQDATQPSEVSEAPAEQAPKPTLPATSDSASTSRMTAQSAPPGEHDWQRRRNYPSRQYRNDRNSGSVALPPISPVTDGEVSGAIAEARKLSSDVNAVRVTDSILENFGRAVHELETEWRHTSTPLPMLFRRARGLRNQAATYLAGQATERQRLHLFVLAGTLQAYLAEALLDLGFFTAAWLQTGAGLTLAEAADAAELHVILHGQRSRIRYWQGNYVAAVHEAEAGATRIRPGSVAAVKLFDKLAIAASRVGDSKNARKALHACEGARAATAARDETYLTPVGEQFCAMGAAASLVILGDLAAARTYAQHAIDRYISRKSSSANLTFAQIELAKAQADPAAAALLGMQAIEEHLERPRRSQLIVVSARQLDAMLPDNLFEVEDFRERLHALESSTRHAIPGV